MRIIDLTLPIEEVQGGKPTAETYLVPLSVRGGKYRAICYRLAMNGMSGTYLDLPGHIEEFDDGADAENFPLEKLFMLDTTVIHLDRRSLGREVTADELESAGMPVKGDALLIHALGEKKCFEVAPDEIPYFGPSAIQWIVHKRPKIAVSDIYEKRPDLQGIFIELFRNRISCVCVPVNLDRIRETYPKTCIIPLRMRSVTQLPCRIFVVEKS